MCGDVEEEVRVLGRGVLGSVRTGVAEYHKDGLVWIVLLGLTEEGQTVVRDQVGEVVLLVVVAVFDLEVCQQFCFIWKMIAKKSVLRSLVLTFLPFTLTV